MPKFREEKDVGFGWSRWIAPRMDGYKMACCDCGLVHEFQFNVLGRGADLPGGSWEAFEVDSDVYRVEFRARRNNRSTGQIRRHKRKTNATS